MEAGCKIPGIPSLFLLQTKNQMLFKVLPMDLYAMNWRFFIVQTCGVACVPSVSGTHPSTAGRHGPVRCLQYDEALSGCATQDL